MLLSSFPINFVSKDDEEEELDLDLSKDFFFIFLLSSNNQLLLEGDLTESSTEGTKVTLFFADVFSSRVVGWGALLSIDLLFFDRFCLHSTFFPYFLGGSKHKVSSLLLFRVAKFIPDYNYIS